MLGVLWQRMAAPHPTTYLGKGKLRELADHVAYLNCQIVIVDDELTLSQQHALEMAARVPVIDRTTLILDIFAQHAQSHEGRLQVELAQLLYRLPRLQDASARLSRTGGGIGTRGPGETQLESDRRRIRARLADLRRAIDAVGRQRALQRRQRARQSVPVISLVGYTNAGKSSVFNALARASVVAENKLFATLDPTTRQIYLPNQSKALLTDTVGFIHKLPTDLIAAFRATLHEVQDADVLLHVLDATHPQALAHCITVYQHLTALHVDHKVIVTALNKIDLLATPLTAREMADFPNAVGISATRGDGLPALLDRLAAAVALEMQSMTVWLPYAVAQEMVRLFRQRGAVEDERYSAAGLWVRGKLPPDLVGLFSPYAV